LVPVISFVVVSGILIFLHADSDEIHNTLKHQYADADDTFTEGDEKIMVERGDVIVVETPVYTPSVFFGILFSCHTMECLARSTTLIVDRTHPIQTKSLPITF
jgi:hypothetical protein